MSEATTADVIAFADAAAEAAADAARRATRGLPNRGKARALPKGHKAEVVPLRATGTPADTRPDAGIASPN